MRHLEREAQQNDADYMRQWCAFMDAFTDDDLCKILHKTAGPDLVRRFQPAEQLTLPAEIIEIIRGVA